MGGIECIMGSHATVLAVSSKHSWRKNTWISKLSSSKNNNNYSYFYSCSITLGGFGADRFYLGQWREGLGKLFSFGGLGIWTLIDVLLIGVGYVGPADGSLYI